MVLFLITELTYYVLIPKVCRLLLLRLATNRVNFIGYDFGLDLSLCPPEDGDEDWISFALEELPNMRNSLDIGIPLMPVDEYELLIWWTLSHYR